jgi:sucrose synthase
MKNMIPEHIKSRDRNAFKDFIVFLTSQDSKFWLRNDLLLVHEQFFKNGNVKSAARKSSVFDFFEKIQELFIIDSRIALMRRYAVARHRLYLLSSDGSFMEEINVQQYLELKDRYLLGEHRDSSAPLIDYVPFYDYVPSMRDARTIGNGIRFLSRYMCGKSFQNHREWDDQLFTFIRMHRYGDQQLLVNGGIIRDFNTFMNEIEKLTEFLDARKADEPYESIEPKMKKAGFEPGWGNTVGAIRKTLRLLVDVFNEPTDRQFEEFINRVPMPLVSKIAIVSPHGWFAQENVLGKPDTGGQVIYILDQVRALERYLKKEIEAAGLKVVPQIIVLTRLIPEAGATTCNQRKEKIHQTDNAWILRIPFRDTSQNIERAWIPRFHTWPFLEGFADEAARELVSELEGRPDLIIGNYSDGNLVASLLSDKLDVVQCTIAHALEKTKYLFSDLYWKDMENDYRFSLQFIADILAMNKTDFIITSTYQEIAGTEFSMGQYESYQFFSLPGLYRVVSGVNIFAPKFNVIPPGVDQDLYFPWHEKQQRIPSLTSRVEERLFGRQFDDIFGTLDSPEKYPIFTMARLDKIKNITGLIEAFGMSAKLQKHFNLVFSAGTIHLEESSDAEEQAEIRKVYELIDHYDLTGRIRWLPSTERSATGETYRIIADRKGVFVQPALFEAFGLTILEAMASGVPTFGPKFGGPLESIEDGVSGYLLNTSKPELIAQGLENYADAFLSDAGLWEKISTGGINRVNERFTWRNYSERLINLTKLYGFWRFSVSGQGKLKMDRYSDLIYHYLFRDRASGV